MPNYSACTVFEKTTKIFCVTLTISVTGFCPNQTNIVECIKTGKRKLAYEIAKKNEGYYVLINFSSKSDFPAELDRNYKISEDIIRSIIIRK